MSASIGLDASSAGWAAAIIQADDLTIDYYPTISSVWNDYEDINAVVVDIPIGLVDEDRRRCDTEAKSVLGTKQSSLFYTPPRDAVELPNLDAAKELMNEHGIQSQAWALVPRIQEVDDFLQTLDADKREQIIETHPEVVFQALNQTKDTDSKKTERGREERREMLVDALDVKDAEDTLRNAIERFSGPGYALSLVKPDDILDATAAALVAKHVPDDVTTLPQQRDSAVDDQLDRRPRIAYYPDTPSL